jgi:hypothetical protein
MITASVCASNIGFRKYDVIVVARAHACLGDLHPLKQYIDGTFIRFVDSGTAAGNVKLSDWQASPPIYLQCNSLLEPRRVRLGVVVVKATFVRGLVLMTFNIGQGKIATVKIRNEYSLITTFIYICTYIYILMTPHFLTEFVLPSYRSADLHTHRATLPPPPPRPFHHCRSPTLECFLSLHREIKSFSRSQKVRNCPKPIRQPASQPN